MGIPPGSLFCQPGHFCAPRPVTRPPFRLLPGAPSLALSALGLAPGEPRLQGVAGRPFCRILARPFRGWVSLGPAWTRPSAGPGDFRQRDPACSGTAEPRPALTPGWQPLRTGSQGFGLGGTVAGDAETVLRRILTPFTGVLMTGRCRFGEAAQLLGAVWDSGTGGTRCPCPGQALARPLPGAPRQL